VETSAPTQRLGVASRCSREIKKQSPETVGTHGKDQDQFSKPHSIAVDAQAGLVYVADRATLRIQVYDTDLI